MKKFLKKFAVLFTAGTLLFQSIPSMEAQAADGELTGKTATEITKLMEKGWNLGNTFDATGGNRSDVYSQEISWGNPQVTKDLIDGVAASGYKTIRIPVTWNKHCDKRNGYTLNPDFVARIKEVVTWAYEDGLFVIINCHHESWINREDIDSAYEQTGEQLAAVWAQIADEFADFDQHLIFEGMNEPRAQGTSYEWSGNAQCYDAVNYLNQIFVETVRANGKGHNNERVLMIPGYAASSSSSIMRSIVIPEIDGKQAENIAVSVHCYSPYNFCLSDNQSTFNPNKSSDTAEIEQLFKDIKTMFTNKGIPVVIGECGCTNSGGNVEDRAAWLSYFSNISANAGVPAVLWDNGSSGSSGGECHKYFMRKTGELVTPELTEAFLSGNYGNDPTTLGDLIIDFEPYEKNGATVIASPADFGFTYSKLTNEASANHTEGAKLGVSMKVDSSVPDFTASLEVTKYRGTKIYFSAWVYSKSGASVSIGLSGAKEEELVSLTATDEWTEVSFEAELPAEGESFIYFKGADNKFNVDDIKVSLNLEAEETSDASDNETAVSGETNGSTETSAASETVTTETVSESPLRIIMLVTAVVAIAAVVVIALGSKKGKKNK